MPTGPGIARADGRDPARLRRTLQRLAQVEGLGARSGPKDQREINRRVRQLNASIAAGTIREDTNPNSTTRNRRAIDALRGGS